ncbi:ENTH/VHS family protein [Pseudocohnilembus persalinus]|uniref:ENTH/VHS family protein n=1 Tax=Pseudocohnilembus persalinus TaxID=266149 RepID=A0A0V0Q8W3_PSEPJ|nr:ENTH/VHS family protein [Pseudocohnilembus persalinus]|eukprot:KRW98672.1 ENTH/VHS family protein [Pseudocohnilembus persalinus]
MKKIFQKINTSNISKRLQNTKQNFKDKINTVVSGKKSQKSDLQLYLEEATKQNGNIVPVKLLDTIVQYSYEGENITEIVEFFATLIDRKIYSANSMIRALIVIEYLLKHGPSEFKEELFQYKDILDNLFNYKQGQNKDKQELIQKKSQFINRLLTEKQLLQKEKQIAMEIKHKMKQDQAQLRINKFF